MSDLVQRHLFSVFFFLLEGSMAHGCMSANLCISIRSSLCSSDLPAIGKETRGQENKDEFLELGLG